MSANPAVMAAFEELERPEPAPASRGSRTLAATFAAAGYDRTHLLASMLDDAEFRLWVLFRAHDHKGLGTFVSDTELARMMARSTSSVQKIRARLYQKGFLERTLQGPRDALWRAVCPGIDP